MVRSFPRAFSADVLAPGLRGDAVGSHYRADVLEVFGELYWLLSQRVLTNAAKTYPVETRNPGLISDDRSSQHTCAVHSRRHVTSFQIPPCQAIRKCYPEGYRRAL